MLYTTLRPTNQLLYILKHSGIVATITHAIRLELLDPYTNGTKGKASRLFLTPKQATETLLFSLADIPEVSR